MSATGYVTHQANVTLPATVTTTVTPPPIRIFKKRDVQFLVRGFDADDNGTGDPLDNATVTVTGAEVVVFPAASRATAVNVCDPFVAVRVSQANSQGTILSSAPSGWPSR